MRKQLVFVLALIPMLLAVETTLGKALYNLTDLGEGVAYSINNAGQVVGYSGTFPSNMRPTLFDSLGIGYNIELGDEGIAYSINQNGQIVGTSGGRAILFDPIGNGVNTDLGTGIAYSINNSGQIVGTSSPLFGRATLFDPTGAGDNIDLGTLGGPDSCAYSINENGQIVGWARFDYGWIHATLFDPSGGGQNINLDALGSGALSINNRRQIVGNTWFAYDDSHATLFDPAGVGDNLDLGTLDGLESYAYSINNKGHIVGYASYIMHSDPLSLSYDTNAYSSPLLFEPDHNLLPHSPHMHLKTNTIIIDPNISQPSPEIVYHAILFDHTGNGDNIALDDLIDPNLGWTLNTALCINDKGCIVGSGTNPDGKEHAYLLTPKLPVEIAIDIKPHACPNRVSVKSKGLLAVAILGSAELDVATIDPASVTLNGVSAVHSCYEDLLTSAQSCSCEGLVAPDGLDDLIVKFEAEDIIGTLDEAGDGEQVELTLTGVLYDDTPIQGSDCILIINKTQEP